MHKMNSYWQIDAFCEVFSCFSMVTITSLHRLLKSVPKDSPFRSETKHSYNCCVLGSNAKWRYTFLFIIEIHSIPDIQKWENKSQYDSNSSNKAMKYGWHYLLKIRILKLWISGAMVFFFFFHLLWCNAKEPKESK